MKWFVYKIEFGGIVRYIGKTGDMVVREKNHNYLCFKKLQNKILYNEIRSGGLGEIKLIKLKEFNSELDARRWECMLILKDYFGERNLWQMVPNINDRPSGKIKK